MSKIKRERNQDMEESKVTRKEFIAHLMSQPRALPPHVCMHTCVCTVLAWVAAPCPWILVTSYWSAKAL